MSLLEKLLPGSYKGVPFLIVSSNVAGGRKDIKHSYPNSDTQTIEDLGKSPRVYNMQISITGKAPAGGASPSNDNYLQLRDNMIRVLEDGEAGKLTHPLYGDIENVKARTFTLVENLTALGDGRLNVVFEISEGVGTPERADTTLNTIEQLNAVTVASIAEGITDNYEVTNSFTNSFTDAVGKLNGAVDAFNENTDLLQASADSIDAYSQEVTAFSNNVSSLVKNPQALSNSVQRLFNSISGLYTTSEATLAVLFEFFPFGDDDTPRKSDTASRIQRNANDALINSTLQSTALSYAYFGAASIIFDTVAQIEEVSDTLENQYRKIVDSDGLSDEAKSNITDLRVTVQNFFETQKLSAKQVIEIDTVLTSARLLSYTYYGTSELGQDLADLNNLIDPGFIEGTVKVLTA